MAERDAELAAWQKHFDCSRLLRAPYLPPLSTLVRLVEMAEAAVGLLQGLSQGTEAEQQLGISVAATAIDNILLVLAHMGYIEEGEPLPKPTTVALAKMGTEKGSELFFSCRVG